MCGDVIRPNVLMISISSQLKDTRSGRDTSFNLQCVYICSEGSCSGLWIIGQVGKASFEFSLTVSRSRIMHRHDTDAYVGLHV